jgi:ribA/ribD-fused uncharacterized protein
VAEIELVLFYGHRPEPDGGIGPGCLSQWWPAPFAVDGLTFATAEHYMMWRKAMLFDDPDRAELIVRTTDPKQAKGLGRQIRGFNQQRWETERFGIVVSGNVAKFGQHPDLRRFLLGTGDRLLVETSPVDRVWGIGLPADDPRARRPDQWRGLNLLGLALAEARSTLRDRA